MSRRANRSVVRVGATHDAAGADPNASPSPCRAATSSSSSVLARTTTLHYARRAGGVTSVCRQRGRRGAPRSSPSAPGTIVLVFRDPLSILAHTPVAMTAPTFAPSHLPLWPSGIARLDDGILEITAGDGLRVAVRDVVAIDVHPALGARLLLSLSHRKGFETIQAKFWVAIADADGLQALVGAVRAAMVARA